MTTITISGSHTSAYHISSERQKSEIAAIFNSVLGNVPGISEVIVFGTHGSTWDTTDSAPEGKIRVFNWTHRRGTSQGGLSDARAYGLTRWVRSDMYGCEPQIPGMLVIYSPEGVAMAEWHKDKRTLLLLADLFHFDAQRSESAPLLTLVLNDFLELLKNPDITKEQLEEKRRAALAEARKKRLVDTVNLYTKRRLEGLENEINSLNISVNDYRRALTERIRSLGQKQIAFTAAQQASKTTYEKILKELDSVRSIAHIVDVDIVLDREAIVFTTDMIYAMVKNRRFKLGRYEVAVNLNNSDVNIKNLEPTLRRYGYSGWGEGCQHPHVNAMGAPCLGNASTAIAELVPNAEFSALATVMIGYLESVNLDDPAGRMVINWDVVDDNGNVIIPGAGVRRYEDVYKTCHICGATHCAVLDGDDAIMKCSVCGQWVCKRHYQMKDGKVVCHECKSTLTCDTCGKSINRRQIMTCDRCDASGCGDCIIEAYTGEHDDGDDEYMYLCPSCREAVDRELHPAPAAPVVATTPCALCAITVPNDSLLTCERCGNQGCDACIKEVGGVYVCSQCEGRA